MEIFRNGYKWLRVGFKDGQSLFWVGIFLFAAYELMIGLGAYEPKGVSALAIVTLGFIAMGEGTIQCVNWLLAQGERSDKVDLVRWKSWGRPIIAVNLAMFWALILQFDGKAPLNAILITFALVTFGLAKTLPSTKFTGKMGNTVLGIAVALPCLLVAGFAKFFGI